MKKNNNPFEVFEQYVSGSYMIVYFPLLNIAKIYRDKELIIKIDNINRTFVIKLFNSIKS